MNDLDRVNSIQGIASHFSDSDIYNICMETSTLHVGMMSPAPSELILSCVKHRTSKYADTNH